MRTQPERSFAAVAIVADCQARHLRYQFPDNLTHFSELVLQSPRRPKRIIMSLGGSADDQELAGLLTALIRGGGLAEFARVSEIINRAGRGLSLQDLLETRLTLNVIRNMYDAVMPHASFLQFYWAWRALFGGLFSASKFSVPDASAYHCISTGYAGLVAARATLETGRPAALTEHGIYTNERRIEILMAEWIADTVEKGLAFDDARTDIRDLWIQVFEAYARITYQACTSITTLYRDNQELQLALGADADRLEIIPNGIDVGRFAKLSVASVQDRPTIALIGRVVPIKDVKTFIAAAALVRRTCPQLRALVMGPNDEDSTISMSVSA